MADEEGSGVADYVELSLRSIHDVNSLVSEGRLEINGSLCRSIINQELQATEDFLLRNHEKLCVKDIVDDKRRVALLHLYPVVKQAENLVRHCCDESTTGSTWPERALSVFAMKEDALDILLHLRWWTSVLDIAIYLSLSTERGRNMQHVEVKRTLERANQVFEDTLNVMALFDTMSTIESVESQKMSKTLIETRHKIEEECRGSSRSGSYTGERGTKEHLEFILACKLNEGRAPDHRSDHDSSRGFKDILAKCIELQTAALKDRDDLVSKALEVMGSYTDGGESRSRERHRAYLLAKQVHSLLTDVKVDGVDPELDEFKQDCTVAGGSFGVVHRGTWCGFDCALKQLINEVPNDQRSEAQCLKRFSHPHIVKFYHHFVASPGGTGSRLAPQSHIVMERMPMDLAQHMKDLSGSGIANSSASSSKEILNGPRVASSSTSSSSTNSSSRLGVPFSEQVSVDIMLQLAKAMWHMHSKNIVHRDLKPGNVLVREVNSQEVAELFHQGYVLVKLGDFGLGREHMNSALTYSQLLMSHKAGTTLYRAPEFSSPNIIQELDGRPSMVKIKYPLKADVWSFGIMSCEILSGERPYVGMHVNNNTLLADLQKGVRPRIPDTRDYLKFCIESCWKFEPMERPRFSDVWRMLRIAKLRSLGLLNDNYDWFKFKERHDRVVSINGPEQKPTPSRPVLPPSKPAGTPLRPVKTPSRAGIFSRSGTPSRQAPTSKPEKGTFSFLMSILLKFNIFGRSKMSTSEGLNIHVASPHDLAYNYVTNMVWPEDPNSDYKLDVIFFEGNVGGRKGLSCRDTWVQRNQPEVFWPQEWLPHDVDANIRVLVLEYCISEEGLEGVINEIKEFLIFRDKWNQNRTWQRPIVLVGHSLGCAVIEALTLDLDRLARQLGEKTTWEHDKTKSETSKAFMSSLRGCFFYAPPMNGLVRREALVKEVFGGLTYSTELFNEEFLDKSEKRSSGFLKLTRQRNPHISLMSLVEGGITRGTFVVNKVFPPDHVRRIELEDSNHIDICKPVNKKHASYQELVKFLKEICTAVNAGTIHEN